MWMWSLWRTHKNDHVRLVTSYWIYLYCLKRIIQEVSSNKKLSSKFLCEEDEFLSIFKNKRFFFYNKKTWGEFSCHYKSTILWRHSWLTRDRSPHSVPTNSICPERNQPWKSWGRANLIDAIFSLLFSQLLPWRCHVMAHPGGLFVWPPLVNMGLKEKLYWAMNCQHFSKDRNT